MLQAHRVEEGQYDWSLGYPAEFAQDLSSFFVARDVLQEAHAEGPAEAVIAEGQGGSSSLDTQTLARACRDHFKVPIDLNLWGGQEFGQSPAAAGHVEPGAFALP